MPHPGKDCISAVRPSRVPKRPHPTALPSHTLTTVGAARGLAATPECGDPRAADRHFTARCRAPRRCTRPLGWLHGHRGHSRRMCGGWGRDVVLHLGDNAVASRAAAQSPTTLAGGGCADGGEASASANGGVAGGACRERPEPRVFGGKCRRCEGLRRG